jgi:opacity protein-like surface antigen
MRMFTRVATSLAFIALLSAAEARADGFFIPFYGTAFGGSVDDFDDTRKPAAWGACVGSMGGGVFGFETDVTFAPDFFAESDEVLFGDNSVTSVMTSVLIGVPMGGQSGPGFRPYFAAGVGLIRQRIEGFSDLSEFSSNNFGYNVGGGAFIFFSKAVGVRGDFRYFRSFQGDDDFPLLPSLEPATFNYTRATAGLVLRW